MSRKCNLLPLLASLFLVAATAGAAELRGSLGDQPSLSWDAPANQGQRWLVVGPLAPASTLRLVWEGAGLRRTETLPVVEGQSSTWLVPINKAARRVSLAGAWSGKSVVLRSTETPPAPVGILFVRNSANAWRADFPAWSTRPGWTAQLEIKAFSSAGWTLQVADDSGEKTFTYGPGAVTWSYSPQAWGLQPRRLTLRPTEPGDTSFAIQSLHPRGIAASAPLPADAATLVAWPSSEWRNTAREWFQWTATPGILVLVTRDYALQDDYLKRLAFFVEKTGWRGLLGTDAQLAGKHGWNAHDYQATDLARFFSQAAAQSFPLNPRELELLDRLVAEGILSPDGEKSWKAGSGALLGISHASAPPLRSFLFTHEAFHGLYFVSAAFRAGSRSIWESMSAATRQTVRSFLARSSYDPDDENLMINEFQAYVLQQPEDVWLAYFQQRITTDAAVLSDLLRAADALQRLTQSLFGLRSGEVRTAIP